MRSVLITRTHPGADATAERVRAAGYAPMVSPVLTIEARPWTAEAMTQVLAGAQAVLLTSAHAARALAVNHGPRLAPYRVFAVGDATAEAARAAGAGAVETAGRDADALAARICARLRPEDGPLVFLRGAVVARDLAGLLRAEGFAVRQAVVYAAEPCPALAPAVVSALNAPQAGGLAAVLFHSARGAAQFSVIAARWRAVWARLPALAISAQAAQALTLSFAKVRVADEPNDAALAAMLRGLPQDGFVPS